MKSKSILSDLPIFGICGFSGSGKTTLIEKLIPLLNARGLNVCVVKHDVYGFNVDQSGKDSDRFFRSGADVLLQGPQEDFFRIHSSHKHELSYTLTSISRRYDIVPDSSCFLNGAEVGILFCESRFIKNNNLQSMGCGFYVTICNPYATICSDLQSYKK